MDEREIVGKLVEYGSKANAWDAIYNGAKEMALDSKNVDRPVFIKLMNVMDNVLLVSQKLLRESIDKVNDA